MKAYLPILRCLTNTAPNLHPSFYVTHPIIKQCHTECVSITESTALLAVLSFLAVDSFSEGINISAIEAEPVETAKSSGFYPLHVCLLSLMLFNNKLNLIFPLKIQVGKIHVRGW